MADPEKYLVHASSSVRDALKVISTGGAQFSLIVDSQKVLLGTVTDGDVRRSLLSGYSLDSSVALIMNKHFQSLPDGSYSHSYLLQTMRSLGVSQIPVLNSSQQPIKVYLLKELITPPQISNTALIMAGGKGTRLRPYTFECPKPMLPVAGKPMLEIIIDRLSDSGFKNIYISVNYLKHKITSYFKDGSKWGLNISYLDEDAPLGTAGCLSLLPKDIAEPILVMNGDIITNAKFDEILAHHAESSSQITVCAREHQTQIPYGVIQVSDGYLSSITEKPTLRHYVNAGIYVLEPKVLRYLVQDKPYDMTDLITHYSAHPKNVSIYALHEYWADVGHVETWKTTDEFLTASGDWE